MSCAVLLFAAWLVQTAGGGFPAVAADEGTIHVVWQDDVDGNPDIYYSRSTGSGSFTGPLNISRNAGISDLPRVIARKSAVSIVWSDTSTGTYQVMLAESRDGGTSFGPARVLSDGSAAAGPPDIAAQDGRLFVAWDETDSDGRTRIVYWDSSGERRSISGSDGGFVPSIAVHDRRVVVAWHTDHDYRQRVFAVHSEDSGKSFSEPTPVSAEQEQAMTPSVSIAPGGRVFIAWSDRTNGKSEIFMASSGESAETYSKPTMIVSRGIESIYPAIQAIDDDNIALVWATRNAILSTSVSATGEPKGPPVTLTNSDSASVPRLAVDGGHSIVVWRDFRAGRSEIFVSKDNGPGKSVEPIQR